MYKIGVILPTFERKELLLRAIHSLFRQTYLEWEVYIVDDGSSVDIESYLKSKNIFLDKRVHYMKLDNNEGVNVARNTALAQINKNNSINFISLLDDDDYFLDDYFEHAIQIIKKQNIQWLVTKCVDERGHDITTVSKYGTMDYLDYLSGKLMQNDATMLIEKKVLRDIWFTDEVKNGYEWILFLHLSVKTKMYVYDLSSKVVSYLDTGLNKSKKTRNSNKKVLQSRVFKECGYNYYNFLSKKYENKKMIKSIYYKVLSLV